MTEEKEVLSSKVYKRAGRLYHFCPACNGLHAAAIDKPFSNGAQWKFNGNADKPTLSPSMINRWKWGEEEQDEVCHYYLRDGKIQYLGDCTHKLAGMTIPLPDIPSRLI